MLGSKTPNSGRKPASIKDCHKGDRPRSSPPPLWAAAEGRVHYGGGFRPEFGLLLPTIYFYMHLFVDANLEQIDAWT